VLARDLRGLHRDVPREGEAVNERVVEFVIITAIVGIVLLMVFAVLHGSGEAAKAQAVHLGAGIYKLCDEGNAIYFGGGGLAVVPGGCPR
jgi:hypothetical protein